MSVTMVDGRGMPLLDRPMSFTAHGVDGFLLVVACLAFLIAAAAAWLSHRAAVPLIAFGLLCWALTSLVR